MSETERQKPTLWTRSQGVIEANPHDLSKASAINSLLTGPASVLPQRHGDPVLPFTIGLFEALRARLVPGIATVRLRRAVGVYARSKSYLLASAQPDAMRHDVDGNPVEPVSPDARLAAQLRVTEIRGLRREQSADADATPAAAKGSPRP